MGLAAGPAARARVMYTVKMAHLDSRASMVCESLFTSHLAFILHLSVLKDWKLMWELR